MANRPQFQARRVPLSPAPARAVGVPSPPAQFAEALAQHQAGQLAEAEARYRRILAARPDHFDSRHLLGVVFLQRGDHVRALRHIELALKMGPDHAPALNNRGIVLQELHRLDDALASFARAVTVRPDYVEAHSNSANVLKALGRPAEALASYDKALALRPDYADAHSNRADALFKLKRFAEALASCDRALALRPDFAGAHCNRANALHALARFDEALGSYDAALTLQPDYAEALTNRGNTLHELGRLEEALASHDRALALRPNFAEAHCNRGNTVQALHRFDAALAGYQRAIALRPDFAEAYSNMGNAQKELNRLDQALASFAQATSLRPDFADAHFNAAHCLLLKGEFDRGWQEYEWRHDIEHLQNERREFLQPQWTGADDIAGRSILIHAEQGFGDTLQFCRYIPKVAERAARVLFEVQRPLMALMRSLGGGAEIIARGDELPPFDVHCPLLSLPLAFGTDLSNIPAPIPYLAASEAKASAWRERLGKRHGVGIGLVWAGDPRKWLPNANRIDRQRSVAFDRLAPILQVSGCEFYSLQKGEHAVAQLRESPSRHRVIDYSEDLTDFSDTAGLIAQLDLVIAVDTAVAHLAGALGKPFWLLNRYNTCWRWLLDRDDSPWYPAARLFRQDQTRDWDHVIAAAAAALQDQVRRTSPLAEGAQDETLSA